MANPDAAVDLFYDDGTGPDWQPAPTFTAEGIATGYGLNEETLEPEPATVTLSLDNRDGTNNPNNPASVLYDVAGRNTPGRLTLDGGADERLVFEVADWKPRRSVEFVYGEPRGRAWTEIEGAGMLRRLTQGEEPLGSAHSRAVSASGPVAYWPLHDGKEATHAASGLAAGASMELAGALAFATVDGPGGAPSAGPELISGGTSYTGGLYSSVSTTDGAGWTIECLMRFTSDDVSGEAVALRWRTTGTFGENGWTLYAARDSSLDGISVSTVHASLASVLFSYNSVPLQGEWRHVRVTAQQVSSTTIQIKMYVDGVLRDFNSPASPWTVGRLTDVWVADATETKGPPSAIDSLSVLGVVVYDGVVSSDEIYQASTGYVGELAADRFDRLMRERGLNGVIIGNPAETEPMGPQPLSKWTDAVMECARTDAALIFEVRDDIDLAFRCGRDLYNQDPVWEIDATAGAAPPLEPTIGDYGVRNDVTAKRRSGSSARAVIADGPMSIEAPPDGIGVGYDTQLDVEPESDARLLDLATFHLHRNSVRETRYRIIRVDLDAYPALADDLVLLEIGDRVDLVNLPAEEVPDGRARGLFIRMEDNPGVRTRKPVLTLIPYAPFEIGIVGATSGAVDLRAQRVDTKLSSLASGIDDNDTALSVASSGGVLWTTRAADWSTSLHGGHGLRITIGGEEMRVTNISGASSPQAFTVVRSVNGVVKAHAAGAPVRVRWPIIVGR